MISTDLQPKGALLTFNGEERCLVWDYGVIEKVQELYGGHPFNAILKILWSETGEDGKTIQHYQAKPVLDLMFLLLNNEIARQKYFEGSSSLKKYTREEIGFLINRINADDVVKALIASWKESIGVPDEDDDEEDDEKNVNRGQH